MNHEPTLKHVAPDPLEEGVALVLRAEESGDWKAVADWMAKHADRAADLGQFLSGQRGIAEALASASRSPGPGSAVGGYELREKIGEGGMGVVYRAHDPMLHRDVAIKLVQPRGALLEENLARFRFEAETVASFDHPNVVRVFASGEADGRPYLVMPLMEGGSLAEKLKTDSGSGRRMTPKAAAGLVRDLALGVRHAHQRGLLHRDLKPGNVLLDSAGRPHVADFGLARPLEVTASISGGMAGTPAYMAPEQARSEKGLTVAVDVHALGAILFELLAGRPPFGTGEHAVILKRVLEEPAPSVCGLRPEVPPDLGVICRKCLEKEPADRYASAEALAEELRRFIVDEPLEEHRRGRVWSTVSRALGRRRETMEMGSWHVAFWGGASTVVAMVAMQLAVSLDAPLWVSQAAIAYYFVGWLSIMWLFLVARRQELNPVERASTAVHFGAKFACLAVLVVELWLHNGNPVYALPAFMAIVGLAIFVQGITYWGRLYVAGMCFFATTAVMPLVSPIYWPAIYGVLLGGFQFQVGFHLLRVHRDRFA